MGVPAPHSSNINEPNEIHDGGELRITETMRAALSSSRENSLSPCLDEDPCFDLEGNEFDLDLDGPNVVDWIGGSASWEDSTEGMDAFPNNAADDLDGIFEDLAEGSSPTNTNSKTNSVPSPTGCTVEEFPAPPARGVCTPGPCPSAAPPSPAGWAAGWGKSTPCSDAGSEACSVGGEEGGTAVWLIEAARHRVEVSTSTGGKKLGRSFGMEFPTTLHPSTTYRVAVFLSQAGPYAARRLPACVAGLELYSVDGTPLHNLISLEPKEMVGDERELFCELQVKMDKQVIKSFGAGRVPQMYLRMNIKTCAGRDVLATATTPIFRLEKRTRGGRGGASPSPAMMGQHQASPCPSGFSEPSLCSPSPAPSCSTVGSQMGGGGWCPPSPRDAAPRKRTRRSMEMEDRQHNAAPEGSSNDLESLLTTVEKMEVQMLLRSVEKMTPVQRSYFQQQLSLMDRVSDVRRG